MYDTAAESRIRQVLRYVTVAGAHAIISHVLYSWGVCTYIILYYYYNTSSPRFGQWSSHGHLKRPLVIRFVRNAIILLFWLLSPSRYFCGIFVFDKTPSTYTWYYYYYYHCYCRHCERPHHIGISIDLFQREKHVKVYECTTWMSVCTWYYNNMCIIIIVYILIPQ